MKLIATIENCDIVLQDDGRVTYTAKAAIDGDGTGPSRGDPDYQPHTALKPDLNSDVDLYIVVPPAIIKGVGPVVLGCQAHLYNSKTNKVTPAVVGDIGPHTKLGEISIACAKALGIDPSPTSGGESEHVVHYFLTPGLAAVVNDKTYALQRS